MENNPYCLTCLTQLQFQLKFYLSIPNPQKPPIKIEKLFLEAEKKELLMKEKFKIHDYEENERNKEAEVAEQKLTSKLDRFKRFDDQVELIDFTNEQVLQELEVEFRSYKVI